MQQTPLSLIRQRTQNSISASSFGRAKLTAWSAPAEAHAVGGDWCEAFAVSADVLVVSIGDVCGHGVGAANAMIAIREVLEAAAHRSLDPAQILARGNDVAFSLLHAVPVTAIIAFFDMSAKTLSFANAGHPPPLVVGAGGPFLAKRHADIPLGIARDFTATTCVVPMPAQTLMVFYTDGVTEHDRNPVAGEDQLRLAASRAYQETRGNTAQSIARCMMPAEQGPDDAAILTIRSLGASRTTLR